MTVTLIRKMGSLPPGFTSDEVASTFATVEEATAQAVADLESGAETRPVRIMDDQGNVLLDRSGLDKAAGASAKE